MGNGEQHRPHRPVDVVCAADVHRDAHRWRMRHVGVFRVTGLYDEGCPHRLLSKVFIQDVLLDALHQRLPEILNDGRIDTAIHQAKRIGRADHAVKHGQIFEVCSDSFDVRQSIEIFLKGRVQRRFGVDQDQGEWFHCSLSLPVSQGRYLSRRYALAVIVVWHNLLQSHIHLPAIIYFILA